MKMRDRLNLRLAALEKKQTEHQGELFNRQNNRTVLQLLKNWYSDCTHSRMEEQLENLEREWRETKIAADQTWANISAIRMLFHVLNLGHEIFTGTEAVVKPVIGEVSRDCQEAFENGIVLLNMELLDFKESALKQQVQLEEEVEWQLYKENLANS